MIALIKAPAILMETADKLKQIPALFEQTPGIQLEQLTSVQYFNLYDIKAIAKKQGVSITAVLLSIFGAAVRKYLDSTLAPVPASLLVVSTQPWPGDPRI